MEKKLFKITDKNFKQIKYGFFTKKIFDSDSKNKLQLNKALNLIKSKNKKVKFTRQIHSNIIAEINNKNFDLKIEADGLITNDFSIGLGILTADCAPIFIFDKKKSFICCLHAGWKGTLLNIAKKSIHLITKKYNKNINDIIVIIGPCLGKKNFEVDSNFKNDFTKLNENYKNFFQKKNSHKDIFDMRGIINYQFKNLHIKNIFNLAEDTYQNKQLFFSYRRSSSANTSETRRMINIICFQ